MFVQLLKSKVHRGAVTASSLDYEGSLSLDEDFMDAVGMLPYERILCSNLANGMRFETYAIPAPRGSRAVVLNGATAHRGKVGDRLTIMSFASIPHADAAGWEPRVIVLGEGNQVISRRGI